MLPHLGLGLTRGHTLFLLMFLLATFFLHLATPPEAAAALKAYKASGSLVFQTDGGSVSNARGATIGRIDGDSYYGSSGSLKGRVEDRKLYNASGSLVAKFDGNSIYNAHGSLLGKLDNETLSDGHGATIGKIEGAGGLDDAATAIFVSLMLGIL